MKTFKDCLSALLALAAGVRLISGSLKVSTCTRARGARDFLPSGYAGPPLEPLRVSRDRWPRTPGKVQDVVQEVPPPPRRLSPPPPAATFRLYSPRMYRMGRALVRLHRGFPAPVGGSRGVGGCLMGGGLYLHIDRALVHDPLSAYPPRPPCRGRSLAS